tara:strand:+ start:351 stop:509 length:159 start_codon:yes stop_codon:yes gene_type:complete
MKELLAGDAMLQTYKSEALNSRSHRLSTFKKEKGELNLLFITNIGTFQLLSI